MNPLRISLFALVALAGTGLVAEERPVEFLRALRDAGYYDIAVDYLKQLQASQKMPENLADIYDLEMCRTLQAHAGQAFNPREAEELSALAQKHLEKFLKEKPDHPEAAAAVFSFGTFAKEKGLQLLRAAQGVKDPEQKKKDMEAARAAIADSSKKFQEAEAKYRDRLLKNPKPVAKAATKTSRAVPVDKKALDEWYRVQAEWLNTRFQIALNDYYLAMTYQKPEPAAKPDPKKKPDPKAAAAAADPNVAVRNAHLKKAAEAFNEIYQHNRVTDNNDVNIVGLYAHMWEGRVWDEMDNDETALDIYEEVLANVPEPGQKAGALTGLEPLFVQVEHFRLQLALKVKRITPSAFVDEAQEFLRRYEKLRGTDGYQGIALELAKILLQQQRQPEALKILDFMVRTRSAYQVEALRIRQDLVKGGGNIKEVNNFDEAVAMGDAAAGGGSWADAMAAYRRALELSEKVKDQARVNSVKEHLGNARLMVAQDEYRQGKVQEALATAKELAREHKTSNVGPAAASFAVSIALAIYGGNQSAETIAQLEKLAQATIDTWPGRPEADDARIALGQAKLVTGNADEALKVFQSVNPKSERYPVALFFQGRVYWQRYYLETKKPEKQRNMEAATAARAEAVKQMEQSLALHRKAAEADKDKPMSKQQAETQLMLAEIMLEGNEPAKALPLIEPLVDRLEADVKEGGFDNTMVRIALVAVRSYLGVNNLDKAKQVGAKLVELGPDSRPVNVVLIEFLKMMDLECRKLDAEVTKLESERDPAKAADVQKAKLRLESMRKSFGELVSKMVTRKELNVAGVVYLAEAFFGLGLDAEAEKLYKLILELAENDPVAARAKTRSRAQLIGLTRKKGDFEEALKQVDALKAENKNSLEPRVERARILHGWAEKEKTADRYDEAVKEWGSLRNLLVGMRKKPPEFYEATYYLAETLHKHAALITDKAEAEKRQKQAIQVLKATLILNATLDGPDRVARYNALLQEISPAEKK